MLRTERREIPRVLAIARPVQRVASAGGWAQVRITTLQPSPHLPGLELLGQCSQLELSPLLCRETGKRPPERFAFPRLF
jgi:hypothetical protein